MGRSSTSDENQRRFYLNSFTTVTGAHSYAQRDLSADVGRRIQRVPGGEAMLEKIERVYRGSEVDTRHLELSLEEIAERRTKSVWQPIVKDAILSLGGRALARIFDAGARATDFDALIVVASAFDGFPGPSVRLAETFGFRRDAILYDLGTLACGGANHGINLAHLLLETGRCRSVCLVCVDALHTHAQARRFDELPSMSEVVAGVVPSDSAAVMTLASTAGTAPVLSYGSCELRLHAWRNSQGYAVAATTDRGEPLATLDKELRTRIAEETSGLLDHDVLESALCVHPGGIALVRRLAEAHPAMQAKVELAAQVLRENGNVGAPSVLFVLARMLERGVSIVPTLHFFAFVPGVVTTLLSLRHVEALVEGSKPAV